MNTEFGEKLKQFLQGEQKYFTTHEKLCYFVIERIYRRVKNGYYFGGIKINLDENLIIDGNHRYIAYQLAGIEFDIIPYEKNFHNTKPYPKFCNIQIDTAEDWDKNNPYTKKYCNDDFLSDGYYRKQK